MNDPTKGSMTAQQLFNRIVRHLRKQGKKTPMKEYGLGKCCQYLASNGTKCAIGCLITKREYKSEMEGSGVDCLLNKKSSAYAPSLAAKIGDNIELARSMQRIHDHERVSSWEKAFDFVAQDYELTVPKKVK
jgi:hypothetical protein